MVARVGVSNQMGSPDGYSPDAYTKTSAKRLIEVDRDEALALARAILDEVDVRAQITSDES